LRANGKTDRNCSVAPGELATKPIDAETRQAPAQRKSILEPRGFEDKVMAEELNRVGQSLGKQGQIRPRIKPHRRNGAWGEMETSVNALIDDLLWPTAEVTRAVAAVAKGDLSKTVGLEVEGRPLEGRPARSGLRLRRPRSSPTRHVRLRSAGRSSA
jgi:hypothetical protein